MLLDVENKQCVWSHECYEDFKLQQLSDTFISFESDDKIIGINVALNSNTGAEKFVRDVNTKLNTQNSMHARSRTDGELDHSFGNETQTSRVKSMNISQKIESDQSGALKNITVAKEMVKEGVKESFKGVKGLFNKGLGWFNKAKEEPVEEKRPDRSTMTFGKVKNFQNTAHVGINQETGQFEAENLPPELFEFFGALGLSNEQVQNPDTQKRMLKYMHQYEKKVAKERAAVQEASEQRDDPSLIEDKPFELTSPPPLPIEDEPIQKTTSLPPLPPSVGSVPPPPTGAVKNVVSVPPPPTSSGSVPPPPTTGSVPPPPTSLGSVPPPPTGVSSIPLPPTSTVGSVPPPPTSSSIPPPPTFGSVPPQPHHERKTANSVSTSQPTLEPKETSASAMQTQPGALLDQIKTFSKGALKAPTTPEPIKNFTAQEKEGFKAFLMDKFSKARLHEDEESDTESSDEDW